MYIKIIYSGIKPPLDKRWSIKEVITHVRICWNYEKNKIEEILDAEDRMHPFKHKIKDWSELFLEIGSKYRPNNKIPNIGKGRLIKPILKRNIILIMDGGKAEQFDGLVFCFALAKIYRIKKVK